jgi:hypothetical protein
MSTQENTASSSSQESTCSSTSHESSKRNVHVSEKRDTSMSEDGSSCNDAMQVENSQSSTVADHDSSSEGKPSVKPPLASMSTARKEPLSQAAKLSKVSYLLIF